MISCQKQINIVTQKASSYSTVVGKMQSMNCEGLDTNTHKEEERAVEQGHEVKYADDQVDQEQDSGEQHAPITADDQEGGSGEHVVQPAANEEQPIDNEERLTEADYMRIIDNINYCQYH